MGSTEFNGDENMARFLGDKSGNFGMMAALTLPIIVGATALAVDYSSLLTAQSEAQNAGDAAILAGVVEARRLYENGEDLQTALASGQDYAQHIFESNTNKDRANQYRNQMVSSITFANGTFSGQVKISGSVDTSFAQIFGFQELEYGAEAVVNMSTTGGYVELHFLVDNSASMAVGATQNDIDVMSNMIGCAFACHIPPGATAWSAEADNVRAAGVRQRIQVVRDAVEQVIDDLDANNPNGMISAAVHTFSNNVYTLQTPTNDLRLAANSAALIDLTKLWGEGGTDIHQAMSEVHRIMGSGGDGSSPSSPRKILVLLTDGVFSNQQYDQTVSEEHSANPNYTFEPNIGLAINGVGSVQALNPNVCSPLKADNITVAAMNVEYITAYAGATNSIDIFKLNYIRDRIVPRFEYAMDTCASSPELGVVANTPLEIERGLEDIMRRLAERDDTLRLVM